MEELITSQRVTRMGSQNSGMCDFLPREEILKRRAYLAARLPENLPSHLRNADSSASS